MHDGICTDVEPREHPAIVEVACDRNHAALPQLPHVVAVARQARQAHALAQQVGDAQRDIAASHEQYPLHHDAAD
jgi:hypothetical protein